MKGVRTLMGAVICGAAAWVFFHLCVIPYRCNLEEKRIEDLTFQAMQSNSMLSVVRARQNLDELENLKCTNANFFMIRAANLRILGRIDESIAMYESALRDEKRPEIFFQLGMAQLAAARRDAAIDSFAQALIFQPSLDNEVPAEVRREALSKVDQIKATNI